MATNRDQTRAKREQRQQQKQKQQGEQEQQEQQQQEQQQWEKQEWQGEKWHTIVVLKIKIVGFAWVNSNALLVRRHINI